MQVTVFLSGTEEVRGVMDNLKAILPEIGYKPIYFKGKFPIKSEELFSKCINLVNESDRMILVINRTIGTIWEKYDLSITEVEFNTAYNDDKPILVFIKSQIWYESNVYDNSTKNNPNFNLKESGLNAEKKIYEFISRIKNKEYKGEKKPPHIAPFESVDDILKVIKDKWLIPYLHEILENYHSKQCRIFEEEPNPYVIDRKTFINNFGYLPFNKENCLDFIQQNIITHPIICRGYYGMGKTYISKILFTEWDHSTTNIYPVYFNLRNKQLNNYINNNLILEITNEIRKCLKNEFPISNSDSIVEAISVLIDSKEILLILDGIDEAKDFSKLSNFLQNLFLKNYLVFLTTRIEFYQFFKEYSDLDIDKESHISLELGNWGDKQWKSYILGLNNKYELLEKSNKISVQELVEKKTQISKFYNNLKNGNYSELPTRPLFLKMLSDLELDNNTPYLIKEELRSNLAEIYYKFIKWKIQDDIDKNRLLHREKYVKFYQNKFKEFNFLLLREIAFFEYANELSVPLGSILEMWDDIKTNFPKEFFLKSITTEDVEDVFLNTTFYSILNKTGLNSHEYEFSHKSFKEYLIANKLASCLFPKTEIVDDSYCNDSWQHFQTHEVSKFYIEEVERICYIRNFNEEQRNAFLVNAFRTVINRNMKKRLKKLDEEYQVVLYYIGQFKIRAPELIQLLKRIIKNKNKYDMIYYRTASISLSLIDGPEYCENYVLFLLEDKKQNGDFYKQNQETQIKYYGMTTLRKVLKKDLDNYVNKTNLDNKISLKLMTFFTAIPIRKEELDGFKQFLNQILKAAEEQNHKNIQIICKKVIEIIDK
jgi:hypothetical protein